MKHQELMCFASILQCKGYINYILLIWSVSSPELSSSCARFSMEKTNIKLKWPNHQGLWMPPIRQNSINISITSLIFLTSIFR